jgi:AraC-like DNA-binding protein
MVVHLARAYGGFKRPEVEGKGMRRRGMLTPLQESLVKSRLLDDLSSDPGLSELALLCGLSTSHFIRAFKQTTGMPPHRWLLAQRINHAKGLLHKTKMPLSAIALECGFGDQSHLTRVFARAYGVGPGAWRRLGEK